MENESTREKRMVGNSKGDYGQSKRAVKPEEKKTFVKVYFPSTGVTNVTLAQSNELKRR
jgi:hypothetical protein